MIKEETVLVESEINDVLEDEVLMVEGFSSSLFKRLKREFEIEEELFIIEDF